MENQLLIVPQSFFKLFSIWFIIILILLYSIEFLLLGLISLYFDAQVLITFCTFSNVALFLVTFVLTALTHYDIQRLLRRGHASFHKKINVLLKTPAVIFSMGNAVLLVLKTLMSGLGSKMYQGPNGSIAVQESKIILIASLAFVLFEVAVALVLALVLAVKVLRFNSSRRPPDIFDDFTHSLTDPASNVIFSNEDTSEDTLGSLQQERLNFMRRRCVLLTRGLQHVLEHLPPHSRGSAKDSLQHFFRKHADDDDDVAMDDDKADDDMLVA